MPGNASTAAALTDQGFGADSVAGISDNPARTEPEVLDELAKHLALLDGPQVGRSDFGATSIGAPFRTDIGLYRRSGAGSGILIGDGRLNCAREQIAEAYYALRLTPYFSFGFDLQRIAHPAYNQDRGPVTVIAFRIHAES